jgi:hypothetical protein
VQENPSPGRGSVVQEPNKSNVCGLFTHQASDQRLFERIISVTAAYIRHNRLLMEIHAPGPLLPLPWLKTLTCVVRNGDALAGVAKVERIMRHNDGYIVVVTEPLTAAVKEDCRREAGSFLKITTASGLQRTESLTQLLQAKP